MQLVQVITVFIDSIIVRDFCDYYSNNVQVTIADTQQEYQNTELNTTMQFMSQQQDFYNSEFLLEFFHWTLHRLD